MKLLPTLVLLFCVTVTFSQSTQLNYNEIGKLILKQVNAYRDSIDARPLKNNSILHQAAEDHADYMSWNKYLGHDQVTYNKQTPAERVFYYGGNFNYIGENVAVITPRINDSTFKTSDKIAQEFFTLWINSTGHRENISKDFYYQSGISFAYDSKSNKLYSAQVFSALGYNFPSRLKSPAKAYGVQAYNEETCEGSKNFRYGTLSFANHLFVSHDSVFIRYHDINYFKKVVSNPNDGYALDIVFRDQLPCNSPNLFHGSGIFDGYMLEPKFQYDLYKHNYSQNPKKLITYIGKLPKGISNYEINLILIKDNIRCDYSYPVIIPSKDIPPFYIEPLMVDTISEVLAQIKLDTTIELSFSFERSSTNWNEDLSFNTFNSIRAYTNFIQSVEINTFSSVEGKEWFNIRLQEERAAKIKSLLTAYVSNQKTEVNVHSKENWEKFNKQIKENNLTEFEDKSPEEIKRYLKLKKGNTLYDSLLFDQRKASATIKIKGIVKGDATGPESLLIWDEVVKQKNFAAATHLLYRAAQQENNFVTYDTYNPELDTFYNYAPFSCNILAERIKNNWRKLPVQLDSTQLINLRLDNKANKYTIANWINLYYHDLYWRSRYYYTDPSKNQIKVDPEIVLKRLNLLETGAFEDTTYWPKLKLNQQLASIQYYSYINDWQKVNLYFNQIFDHFFDANLPINEAHDLALFCNYHYKYDMSVKMLDHYFEQETLNENAAFTLAQTATVLQDEIEEERYIAYMTTAREMNPKRWCGWLNSNFQVMRNEKVKGMYCEHCN